MDIELALQVLDIAEHSQKHKREGTTHPHGEGFPVFDMGSWVEIPDDDGENYNPRVPLQKIREGECGTSACAAGIIALLRAPEGTTTNSEMLYDANGNELGSFEGFAIEQLQITGAQALALFYTSNQVAIDRLRYLINHPDIRGEDLRVIYPSDLAEG